MLSMKSVITFAVSFVSSDVQFVNYASIWSEGIVLSPDN